MLDHPVVVSTRERLARAMHAVDARPDMNQWLAGSEFTAADIMMVFTVTTMRVFMPLDVKPYENIVSRAPGGRKAMWECARSCIALESGLLQDKTMPRTAGGSAWTYTGRPDWSPRDIE